MKIAIVGYGIEGQASYSYWQKKGDDVTIVDHNSALGDIPEGAKTILGDNALADMSQFDMVIRTPQIRPKNILGAKKIWSATNEFFNVCPAPIIGVTGTKGKGTTSSLIAHILQQAGKTVHLLGNIGKPALSVLPKITADDIVVFELSSFQLWDLNYSPQTAVVLMMEADHLNVHDSMQDYIDAKKHIGLHQSAADSMVYHPTNPYSAEIAAASKAVKKRYLTDDGAFVRQNDIVIDGTVICKKDDNKLMGAHNIENICAAITATWRYTQDVAAIRRAVQTFVGLPHRLELVKSLNGVKYYNDSYSSTPAAAVAAIRSFEQPVTLLLGGHDKKSDFSPLREQLLVQKNVSHIIVYGEVRQKIAQLLQDLPQTNVQILETTDFRAIVSAARDCTQSGGVVVLSPGTSSFDMFKNFADRGEQFKRIVEELS